MVKRGESTFAKTVKNIRSKVDVAVIGETISKVRETRNGNVLIEVLGGRDNTEVVRREVEKTLRPDETIRSLEQRSLVKFCDLDCTTTKYDVIEALRRDFCSNADHIAVLNIRPVFGGEQAAVVLIPREAAIKLLEKGRIRVGMVYFRAKEAPKVTHCFRCLIDGHESRNCSGQNRTKDCRRCGKTGHFLRDCGASAQEANAFKAELERGRCGTAGGKPSTTTQ